MAGMKFEYDENGAKFVYFLLSFYAMVIIPCTYYFWPRKETKSNTSIINLLKMRNNHLWCFKRRAAS